MKKLSLLAFLAVMAMLQITNAQEVRFGVKTGLNFATVSGSSDLDDFYQDEFLGEGFNPKLITLFNLGGQVDINFTENIGIGTGLMISGKGYKLDESFTEDDLRVTYDEKTTAYYAQVPVQFIYRNGGFFGAVGPYIGFGVGGNYKWEYDDDLDRETDDGKVEFTNDVDVDDDLDALTAKLAPLDYGGIIEMGYEFEHLRITASYNLGMSNIYPKDLVNIFDDDFNIDNFKATNRVIGIHAAWMF